MNFNEAMLKLNTGHAVTRQIYDNIFYFKMVGNKVNVYEPRLTHYLCTNDTMVSTGWHIVGENKKEYSFSEIILFLKEGKQVQLKHWKNSFIYLDPVDRQLVFSSIEESSFFPRFEDFTADDWIMKE